MYRRVDTKLWTDPKVKTLNPQEKLLFVYLITNSHTHLSGIYYLPTYMMAHETGLTERQVCTCLGGLAPLCKYDAEAEIVWVINMLQYQGRGPKIIKAVADQLESLHQRPIIKEFQEHYHTLSIPYRYPIDGVSSLVVKDQDQEKEQKKETPAQKPRGILSSLLDLGVSEQTAKDFIQHRNKLKAPLTATALKGIKREADKASLPLTEALEMCCARGWRGFKAEWLTEKDKPKTPPESTGPKKGDRRDFTDTNGDYVVMEWQGKFGWQEIERTSP